MTPLVVDASVAFKWLVPAASEPDVPAAKKLLLDHHEGRCQLNVPALLYYEVGNILLCGRARPSAAEVESALLDLFALPLLVAAPDAVQARTCAGLAARFGLTFYDGAYVTLAEALDCPLVTADRPLFRKASPTGRMRLLGAP